MTGSSTSGATSVSPAGSPGRPWWSGWGVIGMACRIVFAVIFGLGSTTWLFEHMGETGRILFAASFGPQLTAAINGPPFPLPVLLSLLAMFSVGFILRIYGALTGLRLREGRWVHERPNVGDYLVAAGFVWVVANWISIAVASIPE
jgi:hypothetical protein